jgi:hypothetical protein
MNHGYIPHEANHRINELYQTRAQMNAEAQSVQETTTDTLTAPKRKGLLQLITNLLNNLMPVAGRISSSDAMP